MVCRIHLKRENFPQRIPCLPLNVGGRTSASFKSSFFINLILRSYWQLRVPEKTDQLAPQGERQFSKRYNAKARPERAPPCVHLLGRLGRCLSGGARARAYFVGRCLGGNKIKCGRYDYENMATNHTLLLTSSGDVHLHLVG